MIPGYGALAPDETAIKKKQLALLERKARDHDIYMAAMRRMRVRLAEHPTVSTHHRVTQEEDYRLGYQDALGEFAELIVEEGRNV